MINVLIPITDNAEKYNKLLANLSNEENIRVFVGVVKSQSHFISVGESENILFFEYMDNSKREEILNSLALNLQEGEVMVIRKPITFEEFNKFYVSKSDIAVCKNNYGKVSGFFHKLWQNILKLCLGVKLYEGDTSVIKFGEDIGAVLSQTHDFSYATRVDRWKGLKSESIDVKGERTAIDIDKQSILRCSISMALALICAITVTLCVSLLTKVGIIGGMLLFCLDVICLAIVLVMIIMICFNCCIGKKHNKRAKFYE